MVQLRIERIGSINNQDQLIMAYRQKNGLNVYYGVAGQLISEEDYRSGKFQPYTITFEKGEKSKVIYFDTKTGADAEKKSEEYKRWAGQVALKTALYQHPFVENPKNENFSKLKFRLVDVNQEKVDGVTEIKRALTIMTKISDMDIAEMRDLCYYIGAPTLEKTAEDIFVDLLKPSVGFAYRYYDKVMNFSTDPRFEIIVNTNKAIHMNIIEIKNGGYFYSGQMVSNNLDALFVYFIENPSIFTGMKRQVIEKDELPISIGNELNTNKGRKQLAENFESNFTTKKEYSHEEHENLRKIAKDMDLMGWQNAKPETLVNMIEKRKKYLAEKEAAKNLKNDLN